MRLSTGISWLVMTMAVGVLAASGCAPGTSARTQRVSEPRLVSAAPGPIVLGEGQHTTVKVQSGSENLSVELTDVPPSLTVVFDPTNRWVSMKAGYGKPGNVSFSMTVKEGGRVRSVMEVRVEIQPLQWEKVKAWAPNEGPTALHYATVIYDDVGDRLLVIGGMGSEYPVRPTDEVWEFALREGVWRRLHVSGDVPPMIAGSRAVAVPGKREAVMFGGMTPEVMTNDLYRIDYSSDPIRFARVEQQTPPPPRAFHGFAYDQAGQRFIVFGGMNQTLLDDTWIGEVEGEIIRWQAVDSGDERGAEGVASSGERMGFAYGFDTTSRRLVIFGGAGDINPVNALQDTWVLDMSQENPVWRLSSATTPGQVPSGRFGTAFAFDDRFGRLIVVGGTTDGNTTTSGVFAYDIYSGTWYAIEREGEPAPRIGGFGLYDAARERFLFGGGKHQSEWQRDIWLLSQERK